MSSDQEEDFVDLSENLESLQGGHERKGSRSTHPREQTSDNPELGLEDLE
jgi:hypothetical protein